MRERVRLVIGIAHLTFVEAVRSRLWLAASVVAAVALGAGVLAADASVWSRGRLVMDTGLFAASVVGHVIALTLSTGLLSGETHKHSEYMLLCRPLTRTQFLLGRLLGMAGILILFSQGMMALTFVGLLWLKAPIPQALYWASGLLALEVLVTAALGALFAAASSRPLAATLTIFLWMAGQAADEVRVLAERKVDSPLGPWLSFAYHVVPDFSRLNLRDVVALDQSATRLFVFGCLYAAAYLGVVITLACIVYERRSTRLTNGE